MNRNTSVRTIGAWAVGLAVAALFALTGWMVFVFAPREATMGDVQRIVYLHISVAWCSLAGAVAMGLTAAAYLIRRNPAWDRWSQAAAEIGWLCATLTLVTGSLWAHKAWNTWWTWEPRLTAMLVLWVVLGGYFLLRSSIEDVQRRARLSAVLAILALADIPMIIVATRWFRGMHPVTPQMDPRMRVVLLTSLVTFTALFVLLTVLRKRQLDLAARVASLEQKTGIVT